MPRMAIFIEDMHNGQEKFLNLRDLTRLTPLLALLMCPSAELGRHL